eukprot:4920120-Lingulodinium_polyedra.AAC.1
MLRPRSRRTGTWRSASAGRLTASGASSGRAPRGPPPSSTGSPSRWPCGGPGLPRPAAPLRTRSRPPTTRPAPGP